MHVGSGEGKTSSWRDDFFGEDYLFLYEPRLTAERTVYEIDFLIKHALPDGPGSILDMPCGFGRHAALLAEKGYAVHGIDNSSAMISLAEERRKQLSPQIQKLLTYEQQDMRTYYAEGKFDAALSLFSSLGYFETAQENASYIGNLCRSLHTDGTLIIDVRNPIRDIIDFSRTNWRQEETKDGVRTVQELDPISLRHSLTYHYESEGVAKEKTATWRHYLLPELADMLAGNDCVVEKTFGNFKGETYGPESGRLIVVAKRR